jgi:hypothetical protein
MSAGDDDTIKAYNTNRPTDDDYDDYDDDDGVTSPPCRKMHRISEDADIHVGPAATPAPAAVDLKLSTDETTLTVITVPESIPVILTAPPFSIILDEIIRDKIFGFVGAGHYRYVAGTNQHFRRLYRQFLDANDDNDPNDDASFCYDGMEEDPFVFGCITLCTSILGSVNCTKLWIKETHNDGDVYTLLKRPFCRQLMLGGRTPRIILDFLGQLAPLYGGLEVLKWVCAVDHRDRCGTAWYNSMICRAARNGHLHVVKWIKLHKCDDWDGRRERPMCNNAAAGGHLHVLKWARANGCIWNEHTAESAACNGEFETLKWLHANGCAMGPGTCRSIASNGDLDMLKWARANGAGWDARTCSYAAYGGYMEILQWARENNCDWDTETCAHAASSGHLEMLKWARKNNCDWDEYTCSSAAAGGHLEVLKWAHENGCNWGAETCSEAAGNGHLEVLKWARSYGCDWDSETTSEAAIHGHFIILKWAHANHCDWDTITCSAAAGGGYLKILQWLHANGCPWDYRTCEGVRG